jgi:hypothetical protein
MFTTRTGRMASPMKDEHRMLNQGKCRCGKTVKAAMPAQYKSGYGHVKIIVDPPDRLRYAWYQDIPKLIMKLEGNRVFLNYS